MIFIQNDVIIGRNEKIFLKKIKMKKFLAPAFALFVATLLFIDPALAQMIDTMDRPTSMGPDAFDGSLRGAIQTFINFALFFLGLVAVGFIIYGGFLYVTSQGDDGNTEKAKNIIIYAVIGIIVILISYALINTIIGSGTGNRAIT